MRGENPWADAAELIAGPVSLVFDVGANIGTTARELSQVFPEAAIYCFEPGSSTFAQLECNTRSLERACSDSRSV